VEGFTMTDQHPENETIEIHLSDHELLTYAMLAHEQDITLNEWFMRAIRARLEAEGITDEETTTL
jgi:hypothetical protein